jgi:hypothetical protein
MAITTYAELQTAIGDWLNRADLDQKIPDFIRLAESTLNDVLRSADMVTSSTQAITSGRATLPADALEVVYTQVASTEDEPLEQITPQQLTMLRRTRTRDAANPRFFAIIGRELVVTPSPSGSLSVDIDYYQRIPALTTGNTTNWLLTDAPHVYLYTSLLHATPFLMDDARYQVFNNTVSQQVMAAVKSQQTLSFDDIKSAGFSLSAPADVASAQQSALAAVSNAANNG